MITDLITDLFVYGTLKRGQCRETMWPRPPVSVRPAFIRGRLYDLGPYPAIWCGDCLCHDSPADTENPADRGNPADMCRPANSCADDCDWVAGEIWSIHPSDLAATIEELDTIEETNQPGVPNLYDHILVRAHDQPGSAEPVLALAYQYSRLKDLSHTSRVHRRPDDRYVIWPRPTS